MNVLKSYALRIDRPLLDRQQWQFLKMLDAVFHSERYVPEDRDDEFVMLGVLTLLEKIDQWMETCPENHLSSDDPCDHNRFRCDCELPGMFCSGVPGILARVENGRVVPDTEVERCDTCRRYASDDLAREKLRELGLI